MPDLPAVTLPAEHVVPAWRNAFLATSDNDNTPALCRTVLVEWYDDGLRFVSTDSYMMIASYAAGDRFNTEPAPPHDEAPLGSVVAIAADKLMADFLKHRAADVKAYNRALAEGSPTAEVDVTFSLGTIDEPNIGQQRLDLGTDNQHLIVSCDTERIALPIYDGEFPTWRRILGSYKPAPRAKVSARAEILRRIGQLDSMPWSDNQDWLELTMANADGIVMVAATGRVPIEGAFVPKVEAQAAAAAA